MEPFGLLNFLQTLLNNNAFSQTTPQTSVENKENSAFSSPDFSAEENTTATKNPQKNIPQTEDVPPMPNAFAQFLENHDARVRNTKKR